MPIAGPTLSLFGGLLFPGLFIVSMGDPNAGDHVLISPVIGFAGALILDHAFYAGS